MGSGGTPTELVGVPVGVPLMVMSKCLFYKHKILSVPPVPPSTPMKLVKYYMSVYMHITRFARGGGTGGNGVPQGVFLRP